MDNKTWFKEADCGKMVHLGLYSPPGKDYPICFEEKIEPQVTEILREARP